MRYGGRWSGLASHSFSADIRSVLLYYHCMSYRPLMYVSLGMVLFAPYAASAVQTVFHTVPEPYALYELPADLPDVQRAYGDLQGDPDTYQFTISENTEVMFSLYAVDAAEENPKFSGILVRDERERGVREVVRLPAAATTWEPYRDDQTKMTYQRGPRETADLEPGTYRFEVSTPDNDGRYRLDVVGPERQRIGYFATLSDISAVQQFHGASIFSMARTGVVLLPILFVIVIVGLLLTWRYARRHKLV